MGRTEGRDPVNDYELINKELADFNKKLLDKPQIIIANKMDVAGSKENLEEFKKKIKDIKIFEVSAVTNKGLQDVADYLQKMIEDMPDEEIMKNETVEDHKIYKFEKHVPFTIHKEDDVWVIEGKDIERMFKMTKFANEEDEYRFANRLTKLGVDDELRRLGAEDGDQVRILDFYFDFKD